MNYLCIYHQILQNVICSWMTAHCIQQEKALCKFNKRYSISVWCNTNHMLINPMKIKSVVTSTQQKHQLSDLSLRLSLDGQNIENVSEHHLLGSLLTTNFDGKCRSNTFAKTCQKNSFCFLNCNTHIKPLVDYALVVWDMHQ